MKILFVANDPKPERWTAPIKTLLPDAEVYAWAPDGEPVDADYAIVWQPPEALFEREKNLKAIFSLAIGVDGLLKVSNLPRHIPVVRLEDAGTSVQMAEHVVHQLVEVTRNMQAYRDQQRTATWKHHRPIRRRDWPVGVMGLGNIGKRVANTLSTLDYQVSGWARSKHSQEGVTCYAGQTEFDVFLSQTRVLINTLPLTDDTRGIINTETLSKLRPEAFIINVGRGEHLVEEDLLTAMNNGQVAHAALDVFQHEPLPVGHPFWQRREITITPHTSARTLRDDTIEQITDKIRAHREGKAITGVVNISRGY